MKMFILGCVVLFLFVLVTALIKAKSPSRQATRKPLKKAKNKHIDSGPLEAMKRSNNHSELETGEGLDSEPSPQHDHLESTKTEPDQTLRPSDSQEKVVDFVVIHVMALKGRQFGGYELLQALLSNGLRYGDKKIFHYHQNKHGQGPILFSLASVTHPGTFLLPNMSNFVCPGLALFMVLKEVENPQEALEKMLLSAKQISDDLGGEVCAQDRTVLTQEKTTAIRNKVKAFTQSTRTVDLLDH